MRSNLSGEFGDKMTVMLTNWDSDAAAQKAIYAQFYSLFQETASLAIKAIEQEAQAQNAPAKDYATTLLAAAVRREGAQTFLATFWMGDGAIAAYGPRGKVRLMGTPDGGEYAGQTRFLDRNALQDKDFGKRISIGRLQDISAVLLMTDGVSDPRFETDNGLADATKWDALWDEIKPKLDDPGTVLSLQESLQKSDEKLWESLQNRLNEHAPEIELLAWLHFWEPGHHDDRTIAVLWEQASPSASKDEIGGKA